jgi:hypothetical protein
MYDSGSETAAILRCLVRSGEIIMVALVGEEVCMMRDAEVA